MKPVINYINLRGESIFVEIFMIILLNMFK